ncbi:MAG: N-acetylmuramoyl-L-alanine amidase [Chthoniobacteraceae bacterium]|nr:N-acetylmuramoyl-L-alanine amidase [Chthoniobacteraceae bacterium]
MKFAGWLICWSFLLLVKAPATDWQLYRFEGRDYVSLDNLATFYGLPAPPVVAASSSPKPLPPWTLAPVLRLVEPLSDPEPIAAPALFTLAESAPDTIAPAALIDDTPPPPRTINLDSGKMQLEVNLNSREVVINGARQWLAFPTRLQDGHLLISRLDLSKVVEPRLRPERIEGMGAVTTIVLDPGHGGHDTGAFSKYGAEKDFALDVALRARELLLKRGYNVAMTRTSDIFIPLEERPKLAQKTPGTIFVSIHFNASDSNRDAKGFEIFSMAPRGAPATNDNAVAFNPRYLREEPGNANELPSAALAGAVYHSLLGHVQIVDRGLKHARFAVLRLCTVPAVLIECGFVTNAPESAQIGSPVWRARVAEAIVEGIDGYKELAVNKQAPKLVADYLRER